MIENGENAGFHMVFSPDFSMFVISRVLFGKELI